MNKIKYLIALSICFLYASISICQWTSIKSPNAYPYINFIDLKGNIFLSGDDDIYYSNDLGETWSKTLFKNWSSKKKFDNLLEVKNNIIVLVDENTLYYFNKKTSSWETHGIIPFKLINIDQQGYIWCQSDDPTKYGIYVSKNEGNTYQFINCNVQIQPKVVESYKDEYYLTWTSGATFLYRLTDSGQLTQLSQCAPEYLFVNQTTGTLFIRDNFYYLSRSVDSGKTITPILLNPNLYNSNNAIRQLNSQTLLLNAAYGNILISNDDGKNWYDYKVFVPNSSYPYRLDLNSFVFGNLGDTVVAASSWCPILGIYKSFDKGKNWNLLKDNFNQAIEINDFVEDNNGFLYGSTCSDTTILKSTDYGSSWKSLKVNNGISLSIQKITTNLSGEFYALCSNNLYKSSDGGNNFQKINVPSVVSSSYVEYDLRISPNGFIFLLGSTSFLSKDDGKTWIEISGWKLYFNKGKFDYLNNYYCLSSNLYKYDVELDSFMKFELTPKKPIAQYTLTSNGFIYFSQENASTSTTTIWLSIDNMKTYKVIATLPYLIYGMFTDASDNIYIQTDNGISITRNKFISLDFFVSKPDLKPFSLYELYFSQFGNLYAFSNSIPSIYKLDINLNLGSSVAGYVYQDENINCIYDIVDKPKELVLAKITGTDTKNTYSQSNGYFNFKMNEGEYEISAVPPNNLWGACNPIKFNILSNQKDTAYFNLGLSVKEFCPYLTSNLQIPIMRRCVNNYVYVQYCNEGTSIGQNPNLIITLDPNLSYISSTLNPYMQNGNQLIFKLKDLDPGECGSIVIETKLNCDVKNDEKICVCSEINPQIKCEELLPDQHFTTKCNQVRSSFDPNDKTAFIKGKPTEGKSEMNEDVEYLIRFQNTGNDTAFRVVVVDNIPAAYDLSTLKPLNSSHPYTIELYDRQLEFIFDPIMLPDSNINEPASHGFIAFKISPNKDLPYGTKLDNYADIYFDFNNAVTTNTAFLTVAKATSTSSINDNLEFSYYPNPSSGELNIQIPNSKAYNYTLKITDLLGMEIQKEKWEGNNYRLKTNSLMNPGLYFISVEDSEGRHGYGKFVVE